MIQEIIDLHYNSHTFIMIYVNLFFQIVSQYSTVVLTIVRVMIAKYRK